MEQSHNLRILVSGATATLRRLSAQYPAHLGVLVTPHNGNRLCSLALPWACDNAAFSRPDDHKFWNMTIDTWMMLQHHPPMWIAAPDIVGDHRATRCLFDAWVANWEYEIGYVPFPLAFVLQNGCAECEVPWEQIEAVFIGGDDRFKLRQCSELITAAKHRGKSVHIGRVNSLRRLRYCIDIGADTVDGTGFSMFPDTKIPKAVRYLQSLKCSRTLF